MTMSVATPNSNGLMGSRHAELVQTTMIWCGTSAGSANAQVISPEFAPLSLTGHPSFVFVAGFTNAGPLTLSFGNAVSLGAVSVRRPDGTACAGAEVQAGYVYTVVLDANGYFRLVGSPSLGAAPVWGGTSTGSANAQVVTPSPAVSTLSPGQIVNFIAGYTATSATPTLQVSSLAPVTLIRRSGAPLGSNDLVAGQLVEALYDGANLRLLTEAPVYSLVIGDAEDGATGGWSGQSQTTITNTTEAAKSGSRSYKVVCLGGGANFWSAFAVPVIPNKPVTLSVFCNQLAGGNMVARLATNASDGTDLGGGSRSLTTGWARYIFTLMPTIQTVYLQVYSPTGTASTTYVDDISILQ